MIEVVRPGALTLVQDLGRPGHGASGVPRGGAFDPEAARAANHLVGNDAAAALLEITLAGPTLRFDLASQVALAGDSFDLRVDGKVVENRHESLPLKEGALLELGRVREGVRAWLAIAGGIDVPLVLGSRSTDLAGGFGGHEGRALRAGDRLNVFPSMESSSLGDSGAPEAPRGAHAGSLRLLPGPDFALLTPGEAERLAALELRVDPRSDRRGVRLTGGGLRLAPHPPRRSQPMLPGAVELTPSGDPILLGVDAPVTGGYPWIAQVVAADLPRIAHLAPGAPVRFRWSSFAPGGPA